MAKKQHRKLRKQKAAKQPKIRPAYKSKPAQVKPAWRTAEVSTAVATDKSGPSPEYGYVGREIRHILFITAIFVLVQFGLWFIFSQTGLEDSLTRLIAI